MQHSVRDYQADKSKKTNSFENDRFHLDLLDKIKDFLNEFEIDTEDGYKASKYLKQLVCGRFISPRMDFDLDVFF